MMKKVINISILCLACFICQAQLYDAKWAIGFLPVTLLDFTADSLTLDSISSQRLFFLTNANICDEHGNFLYVTNGIAIYDKNGDTLQNGTGINPCSYTDQYTCCGLNIIQAALFIPQPGNTRYYYLFHFSNDDANSDRPATIYYTLIDKQGNNGLGTVIEKNIPVFHTTILRGGGMTACKHANGRDYWLIMAASTINTFYKFLITPNGIEGPFAQSIGPQFPGAFDNAYSRFAQNGGKFVTGVFEGPVLVMDFDRCSGEFSNPVVIYNEGCDSPQTCSASVSVEFSPDNRFVYVSDVINLNQYDLLDTNIQQSKIQLYAVDSSQFARLDMLQLAPNGKIYLSSWAGLPTIDFIHVINNPNGKGDSCNFKYAYQPTYTHNAIGMPNVINYRLGALTGSGCDTITAVNNVDADNDIRVYPNPAFNYAMVYYKQYEGAGQSNLEIYNVLGQVVYTQPLPMYSGFQRLDISRFAAGMYMVYIKRSNAVVATQKLVKE